MGIFRCLILMCLVHSNYGWIRFRYPMSRRNYLQQTAREMLQNCGGNPEELCGVCGEGPNELPTELISAKDFQPVNTSEGPLEIRLGFRMNMQGYFELRLCKLGPDSLVNADYCRNVAPLKLFDDYRYIPGNEQNSARLQITLPPETACERCVLQVKYVPGARSRVADQLFFDCALLRIPRSRENLKLTGRIVLSTDKPLITSPFSPPFSTASSVVDLSTSPELSVTTTSAPARFSDLPTTSLSAGTSSQVAGMLTRATPARNFPKTTGFPTNTFPGRGQSSIYLNKPLPTLSNSGKFISIITKPISSTSSANLNRRFGIKRNSENFQNILNRTTDAFNLPNRPLVGLEQLGPETLDPILEPMTSDIPFTTVPTETDLNQTIIINETSTNTRSSVIISVNNVTAGYPNISDIFGGNQTDFVSIENDTVIISGNISDKTSIDGSMNDTFLFNGTEFNITQTEIPLPGEMSTYQSNENKTMNQNVTDIPSRTVIGNYDTYDYNSTYTDYYYDYFTYSDIPGNNNQTANQTYVDNTNNTEINVNESTTNIDVLNETISTDLFTNDTFINMTTPETQTGTKQQDMLNVTNPDTAVNGTETTEPFIFYYDYELVTNDSTVTDNFTLTVTDINNTTSAINDTFTMVMNTTTDIPMVDTEIPLPESSNTTLNDTVRTTVVPPIINITITEIPLNISDATDGQINVTAQNISTAEPNQRIVVVSDTLFDRVLFPTPKPNQRVVEVPNVITIFPTGDSIFPETTTPSQTTISSTIRSQQSTKVTDMITEKATRPITEPIVKTMTTSVAFQTTPGLNITEPYNVNQTEMVSDPYIITTSDVMPSSTDVPYIQPTSEPVSTIDPILEFTSTQADFIPNITSNVTFSTDNVQPTTSDRQTIIDTTSFDITSTFVSEQMINTTYNTFISTPAPGSTTLKEDYLKTISDNGSNMPKDRSDTTPMFSGITGKNLGIDLIFDKPTSPDNIGPIVDKAKTVVDPVTRPKTTPSSTFGQFQGGITYMPEIDGQADTRGGIPIQPGMFIDIFIPKFNPDSKDNIFLQKINTSKILTTILPSNNQKNAITGESWDRNLGVFTEIPISTRPDITAPSITNQRGMSFGKFSGISLPTSSNAQADMIRRRFNKNNRISEQRPSSNRESNFMPVQKIDNMLIDRSLRNQNIGTASNTIDVPNIIPPSTTSKATGSLRKGETRDLFFNLLESPEIMPPIFVPQKAGKVEKDPSMQQNFDDNKRVMSSNTVWKGQGVGNGFGLFSGPVRIQGLEQNADSLRTTNNIIGGTGPVYIPVNEVSIPMNGRGVSEEKNINSAERPLNKEINTTFSTLWDLNRQNRNESKDSSTFVNIGASQDQVMPPYIGIPLVWSQPDSPSTAVERTTNPNEKNWNDLPVPDIMPPIKVRLLNMTSKGTFVDNNSMLNQTDDVNKRILQKLEAIVGELQRNRAILTQTLDVNPAYEPGFQLSFDRFPGQFSRMTEGPNNNQVGVQGVNIPKTNLLSEIVQEPILIQRIGSGGNQLEKSSSNIKAFPTYVNDPRRNVPVSEAHIGSVIAPHNFNLMNMLGISDMRPLKEEEAGIRIRINSSTIANNPLPTVENSNTNQTVIDTDFIGNNTLTMLSNTLKTILSNQSADNLTLWDENTPKVPMLRMDNNSTEETLLFDVNTTEPITGSIKTTEQTIVDVNNMSKMLKALSSQSNSLPKVTSNNQLVISPTVSELLNPFLGTNISLDNRNETVADNITELNETVELTNETSKTISPTVSTSTNLGQTVVSGLETVAMINELNERKGNQRNMTDRERVRDKFIRLTFNNRVQGIKHHPSKRISIEGKYYLGEMQENAQGQFEPIQLNSNVILHEVNPTKNSKPIKNQSDLPLVRLSEFNISPSINERVETTGNQIGSSRVSKSQIVQIEPLPLESNVERNRLSSNQLTDLTKEDIKTLSKQGKAGPTVTKQFFDGSDILMAQARNSNSGVFQLKALQNVNEKVENIYVTGGQRISGVTQREQSNIKNMRAGKDNLNPNDIDLFSGKFRQRLPNSLSLSPVVPSNMCPDGQLFVCKAVGDYSMVPGMRWWCFSHCRLGDCPDKKCECTCESDHTFKITRQTDTTKKLQTGIPNVQTAEFANGQNMFREKTIINLTLNGSETSKVAYPVEVTQTGVGSKMGKLVITKYGKSDSINPNGRPNTGQNQNAALTLSQTLEVIPPPDSIEIRRVISTPANVLDKRDSLNCKGINAFAGKPEIDRWCTINCNRNVCPQELCVCSA